MRASPGSVRRRGARSSGWSERHSRRRPSSSSGRIRFGSRSFSVEPPTVAGITTPTSATVPSPPSRWPSGISAAKPSDAPSTSSSGVSTPSTCPSTGTSGWEDRKPETARQQAAEGVERGFKTVYIKIGFDLKNDLALARAIRDEVGDDIAVRVDANEAWSVFEAIDALQRFEDVGVEFVEQPIDMHDIAGLADLRTQTRTRIGANQSVWLPWQVPEVVSRRAADVIVTDPHQLGGLVPFRDAAALCELSGLPIIKHAFADLGITTVAASHVLGTLASPQLGHQQYITILAHDLLATPLEFVDGALPVPTGPGLGIELDREAMSFCEELYREYGEFPSYGPVTPSSPLPPGLRVPNR
jgi:L-alanine-DL-glutamate epimerase-like enolase superfamily enzyme